MKKALLLVGFGYLFIIIYYLKVTKPIKDSFPIGLKLGSLVRSK